jgi:phage shock protein PspC (stress-responsive transcriptional regulator)
MEPKRLTRSQTDRMLAGICGGLAEYFQLDPSLVRIGVILVCLVTGVFPVCVAYGISWLVVPEKPL